MKKYIRKTPIMAMASIHKAHTGLKFNIWSDGEGVLRNKSDKLPRVKFIYNNVEISVTIEPNPRVLRPLSWKKKFKQEEIKAIEDGLEYVGRNWDILLKHYNDTDGTFDDAALFDELRNRGEYK